MKKISFAAFSQAESAAFEKNLPIKNTIKANGGEMMIIDKRKVKELYPKRPYNAHKGTFGRLTLIVGSDHFPGAAQIATLAALRSGIGIASVVSTKTACSALAVSAKEAVLTPAEADFDGFMRADPNTLDAIKSELERSSAVLIGCGLGNTDETKEILKTVIECANCPIIIDADGINALASCIELLRTAKTEIILTPHTGELARLCSCSPAEAISKRPQLAKALSEQYGCAVVAKSSSTVIASGNEAYLSLFGNNGLSRGGSGDLLAGLISSFTAQGLKPLDAAILGVSLQGLACEEVSKRKSRRGMLASDIIDALPLLFKKIERHE